MKKTKDIERLVSILASGSKSQRSDLLPWVALRERHFRKKGHIKGHVEAMCNLGVILADHKGSQKTGVSGPKVDNTPPPGGLRSAEVWYNVAVLERGDVQ